MTDLSESYVDTNGTITISTGSITRTQVKVTYPRSGDPSTKDTAFHEADDYTIDEFGLHIYIGSNRISSYREWLTVDIIKTTTTPVQPLTPFIKPLDYPFLTTPTPPVFFPNNPFIGPTC